MAKGAKKAATLLTYEELTPQERNLLLYIETCAVDYREKVDALHMNSDDLAILLRWDKIGFIAFGRLKAAYVEVSRLHNKAIWVHLSQNAWALAHQERRAKAARTLRTEIRTGWSAKKAAPDEKQS